MKRRRINNEDFILLAYRAWEKDWFLLTAGDFGLGRFNTMTVAWGSIGAMWGKPFVMAVVRPHRYTYRFMEEYSSFTLCLFPPQYKDKLSFCGSKSGRDVDKIKECGLTPIASGKIAAPGFDEAELIIECRKIYFDDFKPERFLENGIQKNYPKGDYHRMYFGEILSINGIAKYSG